MVCTSCYNTIFKHMILFFLSLLDNLFFSPSSSSSMMQTLSLYTDGRLFDQGFFSRAYVTYQALEYKGRPDSRLFVLIPRLIHSLFFIPGSYAVSLVFFLFLSLSTHGRWTVYV